MNILKRLCDYWRDKKLADKCGLDAKEICTHESDGKVYTDAISDIAIRGIKFKCIKCGQFYR